MVNEGVVLGQKISERGIEVDKAKVDAIEKMSCPKDIKGTPSGPFYSAYKNCLKSNFIKFDLIYMKNINIYHAKVIQYKNLSHDTCTNIYFIL